MKCVEAGAVHEQCRLGAIGGDGGTLPSGSRCTATAHWNDKVEVPYVRDSGYR